MHECAHYANTRRKTRHSQQRVVEAAGHAHAETEEQVAQVIEVPDTKLTTEVTPRAAALTGPAPEPAHEEKGGVLGFVAGGVATAVASAARAAAAHTTGTYVAWMTLGLLPQMRQLPSLDRTVSFWKLVHLNTAYPAALIISSSNSAAAARTYDAQQHHGEALQR